MAIALRGVGALAKADVSATGPSVSVALPAGHTTGDALLLFVLTDDSTNTTADPAGWTRLFYVAAGTPTSSPYNIPPRLKVYSRTDSGSLGSTVALTFSTEPWPDGRPYVLAFTAAYSGVDPMQAIEYWAWRTTMSTTAAQAHPAVTTSNAGDWLLTYRASSFDDPAGTFTDSAGTDTERIDGSDDFGELAVALYDSGAIATPGAQPQRTTTASRYAAYGSLMVSIVLKAPSAATAVTASPDGAQVSATAYSPTVAAQDGSWDLCGAGGLPVYSMAIDWDGDGTTVPGAALTGNSLFQNGTNGWTGQSAAIALTDRFEDAFGLTAVQVTPTGASSSSLASGMTAAGTVAPGKTYACYAWVYSPTGWPDMRVLADWFDASGALLSVMPSAAVAVPAGQWTRLTNTGTAPAGAVRADMRVRQGANPTTADLWYVYAPVLVNTSQPGTAFLPSPGDDVTPDLIGGQTFTYGRDQERQLAPGAVGSAAFSVNNTSRRFSPENTASPLSGDLDPARPMRAQVTWNGRVYPLFTGRIDDYTVKADFGDRTADFTFLDGMSNLSGVTVSTGLCVAQRTGDLVHKVLDEAGWTGGRDIDPGATVVKYWWADSTDAMSAINDLVKSEGPPAVAYAAPDGTFVFRDRHHRLLRQPSLVSNAVFHAGALGECDAAPTPEGALDLARPFTYAHGWQNLINSVTFDVADRAPTGELQQVWSDTGTHVLAIGQSVDLTVSSSDPFVGAVTPVPGTDISFTGTGVLRVLLSRTAGSTARLTLTAVGGPVVVTGCQVRAHLLSVVSTTRVSVRDTESIARHGEQSYPDSAPWAGVEDALAIANMILLHYAQRRPTVQIRVVASDPAHYAQVLTRTVSDRVTVVNDEMVLDGDFFVERVQHTVQRTGRDGRPPVHAVVLGCEANVVTTPNPFTFDQRGAGFDAGVFDPLQSDDASSVFRFDDPVQGMFDTGQFGT